MRSEAKDQPFQTCCLWWRGGEEAVRAVGVGRWQCAGSDEEVFGPRAAVVPSGLGGPVAAGHTAGGDDYESVVFGASAGGEDSSSTRAR